MIPNDQFEDIERWANIPVGDYDTPTEKSLAIHVKRLINEIKELKTKLEQYTNDPGGYLAVGGIIKSVKEKCARIAENQLNAYNIGNEIATKIRSSE